MASREMTPEEYGRFHDAIRAANASGDREALRGILRELISRWGAGGAAVIALLREMRFSKESHRLEAKNSLSTSRHSGSRMPP